MSSIAPVAVAPAPASCPAALAEVRSPRRPRRIAMVTHSIYESDARVSRYARTLAARGDAVEVFALRRSPDLPPIECIDGVTLHRLQPRLDRTARSSSSHLWPMLRFLGLSSWGLVHRPWREPFDLVHVHNIPDFLVFAALFPRLRGAAVIMDIHDLVPELYGSKFGASPRHLAVRALRALEWVSARFAHHVIVSNHLWRETFADRTGTQDRCSVFINHVDDHIFRSGLRTRRDTKPLIIFPGGLQWHQGLDLALHAFRQVVAQLPDAEFHIYGEGIMKPTLVALADELGLGTKVRFLPPVSIAEIARVMANADLGIVPKRADSFGNEAYSTKIMEFMALGVPVVVSRTRIDQYYFNDSVVRFFEAGNIDDLAAAMLDVLRHPEKRAHQVRHALAYSKRNSWALRQAEYLALVDRLTSRQAPAP